MKRETLIALFFGILAGSTIAVSLLFAAKEKTIQTQKVLNPITPPKISKKIEEFADLQIDNPEDGSVVEKKAISVKGKSPKGSLVIVTSPAGENVISVENEDFSLTIPLRPGENLIRVTSYTDKTTDEETLKVYYAENSS